MLLKLVEALGLAPRQPDNLRLWSDVSRAGRLILALGGLSFSIAWMAGAAHFAPPQLLPGGLALVSAGGLEWLTRSGRHRLASALLVIIGWVIAAWGAAAGGGAFWPAWLTLVGVIALAGLLLSGRAALGLAGLSALAGLALIWVRTPAIFTFTPAMAWVMGLSATALLGALVGLAGRAAQAGWSAAQLGEACAQILAAEATDGVILVDSAGRILQVNAAACRLLGHTEATLRGQCLDAVFPGEPLSRWSSADGPGQRRAVTGRRADGAPLAALVLARPLPDGRRLLIFGADAAAGDGITDLDDPAALYRRAIEAAEAVPYYVDYAAGAYRFMGAGILRMTGYAAHEMTPALFDQITEETILSGPAAGLTEAEALTRVRAGELKEWRGDERIRTRAGETRWLADTAVEISGPDGASIGAIGILQDITDRKQAELALRQAEQHLRTVIQAVPVVLFMLDQDGTFTLSEGRGLASLGLRPGQVVGQSAFALYRDAPAITDALRRTLAGEAVAVVVHTTGRAFDMRCDPLRDSAGAVRGLMGVALDVTEREAAALALSESEQRFRALVENGMDAIALYAEDGTILYQSPAVARILGYTPDELVGRNALELTHPQDALRTLEALGAVLATPGRPARLETRARHKDGSYRWLELVGTNLLDVPAIRAIVANYRDVTDRKQTEAMLNRFKLGIERSTEAIFMTDTQGQILFANPAFEKVYGYSPADAIGQTPRLLKSGQLPPEAYVQLWATLSAGGTVAGEIVNRTKEGRLITIEGSNSPILDEAGQLVGFLAIHRDVSERKRAEAALRESEERYRLIADNMTDMVWLLDLKLWPVYISPSAERLTGYASAELMPMPLVKLVTPASASLVTAVVAEALAPERLARAHTPSRTVELEYVRKDGSPAWVELTLTLLRDHQGQPSGFLAVGRSIDERKQAQEALRRSEARFRALIEQSAEAVALLDAEGRVAYDSPSAARLLGFSAPALEGRRLFDLIHPEDQEAANNWLRAVAGQAGASLTSRFRHQHAGGGWRWVEATLTNLLHEPAVQALVANYRDVTERRQAEEALRVSEERYMLAARGANDGLWDWDLRSGVAYFSPRWKAILGLDEDAPAGTPAAWLERVHPEDRDRLRRELEAHLEGAAPHFESEHRLQHRAGDYRWVLSRGLAVRDAAGRAERIAGSLTDITDRKRAEEQLLHDALHDALTGLPNRALFMDRLGQALRTSYRRETFHFGVLFLDLDGFKVVNDSLGHSTGDQLLLAIAQRLGAQMRNADTLARLGGDEFVILLEDIAAPASAVQIAERVLALLGQPFELKGFEVVASASVGVVWSGVGYERPEDILRDADIAMYRAKALGKARYEVFNPYMRAAAVTRLETETDLRRAVEREEFEVYYQPIIALATGQLEGFEALLRWNHPRRGLIAPGQFIPLAEESGLIVAIDRWTLAAACRQVGRWRDQLAGSRPLTLNVNLSGRHFTRSDLVPQIAAILATTGFPADCLRLEITEGVIMENMQMAQRALQELHALGIHVEIDDFGTGYSSLGYLYQLAVDTLKIDRSFVAQLGPGLSGSAIVSTIVNLAHNLNMSVIAEGIETEAQFAQLRELGCEQGQGYFISRPLASAAATDLIARWETLRPARGAAPATGRQAGR